MLAKNNLRHMIARKLRIFPGPKHLHEDILPPGTDSILMSAKEDELNAAFEQAEALSKECLKE
jgi:hypothetical protein